MILLLQREIVMSTSLDPRNKVLSEDEETVEIVEVIEECEDYSDLDNSDDILIFEDLLG